MFFFFLQELLYPFGDNITKRDTMQARLTESRAWW